MIIEVMPDGLVKWIFYRKTFRKARWRKAGKRQLAAFMKHKEERDQKLGLAISGVIIVC